MTRQPATNETVVRRSAKRVADCDASLPRELADALFDRPEALVEAGELLRVNGARRTVLLQWGEARFVLKHYVEPTRRHALKQLVQRSRARSSWLMSHRLADAEIATPRPVACIENRWGGLQRDSFLMYPYVEGRTLGECLKSDDLPVASLRALWHQLVKLWDRLKELRVSLADTNVGNFIVTPDCRLWVIDLDKSRFHRLHYVAHLKQRRGWQQVLRSAVRHCTNPSAAAIFGGTGGAEASAFWRILRRAA